MAGRKKRGGPELLDVNLRLTREQIDYILKTGKERGIKSNWGQSPGGVDRSATVREIINEHIALNCT